MLGVTPPSPKGKSRGRGFLTSLNLIYLRIRQRQNCFPLTVPLILYILYTLSSARTPYNQSNIEYTWIVQTNASGDKAGEDLTVAENGLQYTHMAMLDKLPNGSLVAAFQASATYYEGSEHQALFWTTSRDGKKWTPPEILVQANGVPVWSPVFLVQGGRTWLFYSKSSPKCKYWDRTRAVWRWSPGGDIMYIASSDSGVTWSSPQGVYSYQAEGGIPK
ncbi:hypothetical protein CYMTET_36670, partial [Cymbomonas tetramitiformis]